MAHDSYESKATEDKNIREKQKSSWLQHGRCGCTICVVHACRKLKDKLEALKRMRRGEDPRTICYQPHFYALHKLLPSWMFAVQWAFEAYYREMPFSTQPFGICTLRELQAGNRIRSSVLCKKGEDDFSIFLLENRKSTKEPSRRRQDCQLLHSSTPSRPRRSWYVVGTGAMESTHPQAAPWPFVCVALFTSPCMQGRS